MKSDEHTERETERDKGGERLGRTREAKMESKGG